LPTGDLVVVSAVNLGDRTRYRVVSRTLPAAGAQPTEPSLEDGYVALMQERRTPAAA
jgi:hypothetical protein